MEFDDQEEVGGGGEAGAGTSGGGGWRPGGGAAVRYRECLKNHAVGIGGHAVDGCGEFMAAGEEGTLDALRCAACNCHRNFHRKEIAGQPYYRIPAAGYLQMAAPPRLALPSTAGREHPEETAAPPGREGKKRFRTKFTQEQKEKMLAFAEKVGWRIQKHDEAAVQEFCQESGVKRHVLKVWMHNNKHTLGMKPSSSEP